MMLLSGCNGLPTSSFASNPAHDQAFIVYSGAPMPMLLMASAIQWNAEYAVTAKHTPFISGVVHEGLGDVVFFRHKAEHAPQWRQFVPGEAVTAVGFNGLSMPVEGRGHALGSLIRLKGTGGGVFYSVHDGPLVKGMSGGPLFADDGKVVGINVAYIAKDEIDGARRPDLAGAERISVFMPYAEIDREWRRYQYKLAHQGVAPQAPKPVIGLVAKAPSR